MNTAARSSAISCIAGVSLSAASAFSRLDRSRSRDSRKIWTSWAVSGVEGAGEWGREGGGECTSVLRAWTGEI